MARDKRKVIIQIDNEARHSLRQKRAQPLMQSRNGVVSSEPTERHVTRQAKHVEARTKARFDCPTIKRTEVKHVEAKTKARVCDDAPGVDLSRLEFGQEFSYDIQAFSTYEPTVQSMRLLDRYYFLALMDPPPYFYAASVREFFSTLEDWRGEIARILAPQGTRCRLAITLLEMPQILWRVVESRSTHHGYHHLFFHKMKEKQLASSPSYLIPLPRPLPSTPTFNMSLPVLPIYLPPPFSSAPELAVPISTLAVPELFVSMDSRIDARLSVVGQVDGEIFICATDTGMDIIIWDDPPMVQDLGEAITPIVEITDQATTPVFVDIDGVVDPIIGA
ncbi:hypothetical protein AAG906_019914 [Vitis piasezkii]